MSRKPVLLREVARRDIAAIIDHYREEAGPGIALRFVGALEKALTRVGARPAAGSPRYAHELGIPGLRFRSLTHFPYMVFYVERVDAVDVWRLLHAQRDIPAWMAMSDP